MLHAEQMDHGPPSGGGAGPDLMAVFQAQKVAARGGNKGGAVNRSRGDRFFRKKKNTNCTYTLLY